MIEHTFETALSRSRIGGETALPRNFLLLSSKVNLNRLLGKYTWYILEIQLTSKDKYISYRIRIGGETALPQKLLSSKVNLNQPATTTATPSLAKSRNFGAICDKKPVKSGPGWSTMRRVGAYSEIIASHIFAFSAFQQVGQI